jgi:carbon monoxide dehydrogenase subunit G
MTRQVIYENISIIDQPISIVWSLLSGFGAIKGWMPRVHSCSVEGDGIGAIRTVSLGGMEIREKLEIYDPESYKISYRLLEPTGLPMTGGRGTVSLEAKGTGQTQITWTADAEETEEPSVTIALSVLKPFIINSIEGLEATLSRPGLPST